MADTGPCGPCTEIYVDLAQRRARLSLSRRRVGRVDRRRRATSSRTTRSSKAPRRGGSSRSGTSCSCSSTGRPDGTLNPLPKPSVDTGAGLERIAAVKQGVTNNFHTDLFAPLHRARWRRRSASPTGAARATSIAPACTSRAARAAASVVPNAVDPASFRVLADHARAVAFLLADGVFPSNEGRGYVLRRILRRAVRHAYLLGRREPTLVHVVQTVIDTMGDVYPELRQRAEHLRADDARRGAGIPRDDRGWAHAVRAARAGGVARTRGRSAARTRSVSTTPSASRST